MTRLGSYGGGQAGEHGAMGSGPIGRQICRPWLSASLDAAALLNVSDRSLLSAKKVRATSRGEPDASECPDSANRAYR
jgi:hypothetical protein